MDLLETYFQSTEYWHSEELPKTFRTPVKYGKWIDIWKFVCSRNETFSRRNYLYRRIQTSIARAVKVLRHLQVLSSERCVPHKISISHRKLFPFFNRHSSSSKKQLFVIKVMARIGHTAVILQGSHWIKSSETDGHGIVDHRCSFKSSGIQNSTDTFH